MPKKKNEEYERINRFDWKKVKDWKYPYKGHTLSDPKYIKDRTELFDINGNGWWWKDGWWNGKDETSMEYNRKNKKKRGKTNE